MAQTAICLLTLLVINLVSTSARSRVNSLPEATSNPVPHIPVNPFGLYGSPLGKTISAMMIDKADVMHHSGLESAFDPDSYMLTPAKALAWTHDSLIPSIRHHHHHDEQFHECHEAYPAESIATARARRNRAVFAAYILDPANYAAMTLVTDWENIRWPKTMVAHVPEFSTWRDKYGECTPAALARQIAQYSMAHYDTISGYWPEQTIYAALTLKTIFIQDSFMGKKIEKEPLAEDVFRLIGNADRQRARLMDLGLWQRRDHFSAEWFDALAAEGLAFAKALQQSSSQSH